MISLLALVFSLAGADVDRLELDAVLEWRVTDPPPTSVETVERVITAALAANHATAPGMRYELLLRRGVARFHAGSSEKDAAAAKDFADCKELAPDDAVVESYRIAATASSASFAENSRAGFQLQKEAEALVAKHPDSPLAYWALAFVLDQHRIPDYRRILSLLDECLRLDPRFADAYGSKAIVFWLLHDFEACLENLRLARECPPGSNPRFRSTARYYEALAHLGAGRFSIAVPILAENAQTLPVRAGPRFRLWVGLSAMGRAASSEAVANDLIERFPTYGEGYVSKAVSLSLRGNHRGARDSVNKLARLRESGTDDLKPWVLARVAQAEGNLSEAVTAYELAIDSLNDARGMAIFLMDAQFRLALLRSAASDKDLRDGFTAIRLARTLADALDESAGRRLALLLLACGHAENGDFDDALAAVDQSAKGDRIPVTEAERREKLRQLFQKRAPYRMGAKDPADRLVEIPAVACYFGPLKKIDLDAEPALTLPDE